MGSLRQGRLGRRLSCLVVAAAIAGAAASPARAFDFFGLFGSDGPPKPSASALPYDVTFDIKGDDDVESALQDSSNLYKLRTDAPPDGYTLVQRATADFAPIIDALWGSGYYDARVKIIVAGVTLELGRDQEDPAARAAGGYRNRERVPVKVTVDTGPLFKLRDIRVVDQAMRRPFSDEELPPFIVKLKPGDPATTAQLRAAQARIADWFRSQSHPLVKVPAPEPVVDHVAHTMDVTYFVAPGPKAGIGEVSLTGPKNFDQSIVRSFIYLEPGEPYTPKKLDDTRKSISSIPAVGSVRIREADHLDRVGNLPIFVEVTDRAPNLVGFSAGYSTIDGPNGRVYYENRNLFGGAERLRLQGEAFLAPRNDGTRIKNVGDFRGSDIGARFTLSFLKPALDGTRWDFLFDGIVERNRTGGGRFGGYTDRLGGATAALRYRLDDQWSVSGGVKYERGKTSDVISNVDYQLVGLPVTLRFDNTDKPLDPTKGIRATATLTPYADFLGSSVGFTRATATASGYYALDEEARYILAGRVGLGSLFGDGGPLAQIPSNYRFYAGGAGSVRGYRFQSIGPSGIFGFTVGGRSEFDASVEARIKITDTIGIAPFVDAGGAYSSPVPGMSSRRGTIPGVERTGDTRASAGIGLLYYTGIGPIRLDVATPLNPRLGDKPVVLYVSIGQSF